MSMNDNDKKEREFLRALQDLVKTARTQGGFVSEDQLGDMAEKLSLTEEQRKQVEAYLTANKIGIDTAMPVEELLTKEEHDYLAEYSEEIAAIERPSESIMDAIKLGAMAGEKDRQELLVTYMLQNVIDTAKLYAGQGVFLEDLIGAGNEQLLRGVTMLAPLEGPDEVEPTLLQMIMNTMEDLIAENLDAQAADQEMADLVNKVADAARELAGDLGRKVSAAELAAEGEISLDEIEEAIRISAGKIEDLEA